MSIKQVAERAVARFRTEFSPAERRQIACARMALELLRFASAGMATDSERRELVATMLAESNGLDHVAPSNGDGTTDHTWWQLNSRFHPGAARMVGRRTESTQTAWQIYLERGLKPWYASAKRHLFYRVVDEAMRLERIEDGRS
ncbi:MAG: hypothetical protein ACO3S5_13075 [Ilumatobacteraceae bacterium]